MGSSRTRTRAPVSIAYSARASAIRCHCPPLRSVPAPYWGDRVVSQPCGSDAIMPPAPARSAARSSAAGSGGAPPNMATFSAAVSGNRVKSW